MSGWLDGPLHSSAIRWFWTQKGWNGPGLGAAKDGGRGVGVTGATDARVGRGVALAANGLGTDGNGPHALATTTIAGTATTKAPTHGLAVGGTTYGASVPSYRAATGQGVGTNMVAGVDRPFNDAAWLDAILVGTTLGTGTAVIGKPVPNISDIAYPGAGPLGPWMYVGAGPLVGAARPGGP